MAKKKKATSKKKSVRKGTRKKKPSTPGDLPAGLTVLHEFAVPVGKGVGRAISWSPDGRMLAIGTDSGAIWLWDSERRQFEPNPIQDDYCTRVTALAWARDGKQLAFAGRGSVVVAEFGKGSAVRTHTKTRFVGVVYALDWSPEGAELAVGSSKSLSVLALSGSTRTLEGHSQGVAAVLWLRNGQLLSGSLDGTIGIWDPRSGKLNHRLQGHEGYVVSLVTARSEGTILSGSSDRTVRVWRLDSASQTGLFEGHGSSVYGVDISGDDRLAASHDLSGRLRLWRLDTFGCVADIDIHSRARLEGAKFHPTRPWLAVVDIDSRSVKVYELDVDALIGGAPSHETVRYSNAKVVLVGDTGVGKSGLSTRLVHGGFEPTESTHGRRVLTLDSETVSQGDAEIHREILLWDLAGQPGYRLVHQLHMADASIALVLFDARSETDPFGAAGYWAHALDQAQSNAPIKKFLVASRTDRGGVGVSESRIERFQKEYGFSGYIRTSAKTGEGCDDLARLIRKNVDWSRLPVVSSTRMLADVRAFVVEQKGDESPSVQEIGALYAGFQRWSPGTMTEREFSVCLHRLEQTDDVDVLLFKVLDESASAHDYVLLEPSYVDAYASALVIGARDEPDGIGHLLERDILDGRVPLDEGERLPDADSERRLLLYVVEELILHEIALREPIDGASYLVFPSQYTRDAPFPGSKSQGLHYDFAGPVRSIFTTLLARLAHSTGFTNREFYRDAAIYESQQGGTCIIQFADREDGRGSMTVFFEADPTEEVQRTFLEYVYQHLQRNAIPGSIVRRRTFNCPKCGYLFSDSVVGKRLRAGKKKISCPECDTSSPLLELSLVEGDSAVAEAVRHIDEDAQAALARQLAVSAIQGKRLIGTYDLILIGHDDDTGPLLELAECFHSVGLRPWLDVWEATPDDPKAKRLEEELDRVQFLSLRLARAIRRGKKRNRPIRLICCWRRIFGLSSPDCRRARFRRACPSDSSPPKLVNWSHMHRSRPRRLQRLLVQ